MGRARALALVAVAALLPACFGAVALLWAGVERTSVLRIAACSAIVGTVALLVVAGRTVQTLIDLEREVEALEVEELERLFLEDGIHLTDAGVAWMSERIAAFLEAGVLDAACGQQPVATEGKA
jgi:hypothetical protein